MNDTEFSVPGLEYSEAVYWKTSVFQKNPSNKHGTAWMKYVCLYVTRSSGFLFGSTLETPANELNPFAPYVLCHTGSTFRSVGDPTVLRDTNC